MGSKERFKQFLQQVSNEVYHDLPERGKRLVNKTYRTTKRAGNQVQQRTPQGKRIVTRKVLGTAKSFDEFMMHEVVGYTKYSKQRSKPRKVVGKR